MFKSPTQKSENYRKEFYNAVSKYNLTTSYSIPLQITDKDILFPVPEFPRTKKAKGGVIKKDQIPAKFTEPGLNFRFEIRKNKDKSLAMLWSIISPDSYYIHLATNNVYFVPDEILSEVGVVCDDYFENQVPHRFHKGSVTKSYIPPFVKHELREIIDKHLKKKDISYNPPLNVLLNFLKKKWGHSHINLEQRLIRFNSKTIA